MKITILGTGTSQGIPVIGCNCNACTSTNVKDDRLRSAILVEKGSINILVDTSPDLRQQMLRHNVEKVDAVLYTHEHNDHVIGLDDIRPFNFKQKKDMPLFGLPRVMNDVKSRFAYVFSEQVYPGTPRGIIHHISSNEVIDVLGVKVQPIPILHGNLPILGYRFGDFSFITDASLIGDTSLELLKGSKFVVLNALRREPHHSHFNLEQALEIIELLKPEQAYLTHISHRLGPVEEWEPELPENVSSAYDGLEIYC